LETLDARLDKRMLGQGLPENKGQVPVLQEGLFSTKNRKKRRERRHLEISPVLMNQPSDKGTGNSTLGKGEKRERDGAGIYTNQGGKKRRKKGGGAKN